MTKVYLSLGSNIGNKKGYLKKAINILITHPMIQNLESSSFYETVPQGYVDQDVFVNNVVSFNTLLDPFKLLNLCQEIETKLKRVRLFRWGPRTIDVDILLYGTESLKTKELTIPHPRMYERGFVIIPLSELNPSFNKYVDKIKDQGVVKL